MRIQDYPPPARTLDGNELLPAIQDGANVAMSSSALVDLAAATVNAYLAQAISLFNVQLGSGGATFSRFLDTVSGSDAGGSYDGTTPAKAWRGFTSYIALGTAIAGLPLGVARGSNTQSAAGTQISLTGTNVRVGGYGDPSLPRPIFDSSILLPNAGFTADGTYASMWNANVAGLTVTVKNVGNILWRDPATGKYRILKQYASKAALNTAGGDGCYVGAWSASGTPSASGSVSIRVSSGTVPTNGIEYRLANGVGLEILGDGAVVTDVITRNNGNQDGSLRIAGARATVRRSRIENGSRHNAYSYLDGATWEDNYFVGGDNQLESGQGMNALVLNQPSMTGLSFVLRRNVYDGDGYAGATGQINHDSVAGNLCGTAVMEDETYIGLSVCFASASSGLAARRPVLKTHVASGIACGSITSISAPGADTTITNATGAVNSATNSTAAGTLRMINSSLTVPDLANGSVGFYRVNSSSGDLAIQSTNEALTIGPITTNPNGTLKPIVYMQRGSFAGTGSSFRIAGGETLGHDLTHGWYGGFSGGTFAATGGGNLWPYGVAFTINGTTYATLAAAQAAGFETGSTQQLPKTPFLSANLSGADANLESVSPWVQTSGTAASMGVRSNKIAILAPNKVNYKLGDHFASGTVTFAGTDGVIIPAGTPVTYGAIGYTTTAAAAVVGGTVSVNVIANVAGATGTAPAGAAVTLGGGIVGVTAAGTAPAGLAAGGAVQFDVAATNMGLGYVHMKMADIDNWIGCRCTGTQYIVSTCVGGTISQNIASSALTPTAGDRVMLVARVANPTTGLIRYWLYVNDRLLGGNSITNTTLAAATGFGIFAWNAALNPFIAAGPRGIVL